MVRTGAAHEFGRRHYRWFAAVRYGPRLLGSAAAMIGLLVSVGIGWWLLRRLPATAVLLAVAGTAVVFAVGRLLYLISSRHRGAGGSLSLVVPLLVAVACVGAVIYLG